MNTCWIIEGKVLMMKCSIIHYSDFRSFVQHNGNHAKQTEWGSNTTSHLVSSLNSEEIDILLSYEVNAKDLIQIWHLLLLLLLLSPPHTSIQTYIHTYILLIYMHNCTELHAFDWTGQITHSVKSLPYKHEDLSSHPCKSGCVSMNL